MKYRLLLILFLIPILSVMAQPTTAQDWTKTDCSGNSQHLFGYLDSNKVAVMLFEMGCSGCAAGGKALEGMKQYFDVANPGKVKFFAMGYWVGQTCAVDVVPFLTANNLSYPGFDHCLAEKNYYTSASPMPMIVVAAGTSHALSYLSISYAPSDSITIFQAIDSTLTYLATAGVNEIISENSFVLFPNPSSEQVLLTYSLKMESNVEINLFDISGRRVKAVLNENCTKGKHGISIDTHTLTKGVYFFNINVGNSKMVLKLVVK